MEIKIDRNVPVPKPRSTGVTNAIRRLARDGSIGDSILLPLDVVAPGTLGRVIHQVVGPGCMSLRKTANGYRVWKVSESALVPSKAEVRK